MTDTLNPAAPTVKNFFEFLDTLTDFPQTEDLQAWILPLFEQVAALHAQNLVAPLDGVGALRFAYNQLWFENSLAGVPVLAQAKLDLVDPQLALGITERLYVDEQKMRSLTLGTLPPASTLPEAPLYLPGYVCWEAACGHHDRLGDIFVLGLVLASVACRLNLSNQADLERFVAQRHNLFALNPRLNPVWARLIVRMTELSRRKREPDLNEVIYALHNYRMLEKPELTAAGAEGGSAKQRTRQLQQHLRDRLFEVSRRNRMLYFKSSAQTLNMTVGSFPLMLDVRNIMEQQLFYWHADVARQICSEQPIPLQKYLRFEDLPFLAAQLDTIRATAQRDLAEYGFSQLRMAVCMFRWHNFKDDKDERITTPLLLLPVTLARKKGVRDTYMLQATTSVAEINPVLRHVLRQVYGMELPETVDLEGDALDTLHADMQRQVRRSEPGITLHKIDRPQIMMIRKQAKLRLDQYEKRRKKQPGDQLSGQLSGSTRRSHGDLEYSYERSAFHPLGVQIFLDQVQPQPAPLSGIAGAPRPMFMREPEDTQLCVAPAPDVGVIEQQTYAIDDDRPGSPYDWEFDLCSITLGNFNYRKMSLVRDYNAVLQDDLASPSFDGIFALDPRRQFANVAPVAELASQFTVVPQDPTQARAIVRAQGGASMIIQGPPGTGKSQTITNLIADFVARGKRVMFVCEKRAAIDVVYHRLQQQGLEQLCALIHDSQGDKKAFVKDLKACYEGWMAPVADPARCETQRTALLAVVQQEQQQLAAFSARMTGAPPFMGIALRELYQRIAVLNAVPGGPAGLAQDQEQMDALPDYSAWLAHGPRYLALIDRVREAGADPVLARHPVRHLHPALLASDNPAKAARAAVADTLPLLEQLQQQLQALPAPLWASVDKVRGLGGYLRTIAPLLARQLPELLDPQLPRSAAFNQLRARYRTQVQAAQAAALRSANWRSRPPAAEVSTALAQAALLETQWYAFVKPAYWQLRALFKGSYDTGAHAVKPRWSECLQWLQDDYQAQAALAASATEIEHEWHVDDVDAFAAQVEQINAQGAALAPGLVLFQAELAQRRFTDTALLLQLATLIEAVLRALDASFTGVGEADLGLLARELHAMQEDAKWLPLLAPGLLELSLAPAGFAQAARNWRYPPEALELAIARAALARAYQEDPALSRQSGEQVDQLCARLGEHVRQLHALNADVILERRRNNFLDRIALANKSVSQLAENDREFKKRYTAGRRDLENEFSKMMRYKAIRELASADSGLVVRDLKPVWMMSPLSISDTLPMETDYFDVVIFDEASQIPVEEAIPSLYRSPQVIIVGDEMQLPPTNFFGGQADNCEVEEDLVADLSSDSFLTQAAKSLPSTMLEWHYRSRSEALITFSSHRFYDGRLLTIPDHALSHVAEPIVVHDTAQVAAPLAQALERPVSFHYLPAGVYSERRNAQEAAYIAALVRRLLVDGSELSLGVVAFSEAQQDEITQALDALAREDKAFSTLLDAAYEREEDEQFCGLFIKNLENVQGDERDLVIMSVCYGYDAQRKMLMNFGPINRAGGEKRLNVVFSRAKRHMFLVSSIRHGDIKNDYNPGAYALKAYLQFAELSSIGDQAGTRQVIDLLGGRRHGAAPISDHPVVAQLRARFEQCGYQVDTGIGQSGLRCDIGVRKEGDTAYRLGVLVDTDDHYGTPDLLERYLQQPGLMAGAGWPLERVFSKDWIERQDEVMARLLARAEAVPAS